MDVEPIVAKERVHFIAITKRKQQDTTASVSANCVHIANGMTQRVAALTSTQGALRVKDVPSQGDSLGHHLPIKGHFLGVIQGVAHQRGAKHILHGLAQISFVAHQRQSCVHVVLSNLQMKRENPLAKLWQWTLPPKKHRKKTLTRFLAALTTLSSSVLAEILFKGIIVYLRCSSPFSNNFLPVTFEGTGH